MPNDIHRQADALKALANPVRILLLQTLRTRAKTASDLVRETRLSKANVSQHINLLKREGFVACVKRGSFCHYSLADRRILPALASLEKVASRARRRANSR